MGIGTIGEYIPIISLAMSYPIYYDMYRYTIIIIHTGLGMYALF